MSLAAARPARLIGVQVPRLAPPLPVKTKVDELRAVAAEVGINLIPAQDTASRYLMATGADGWLYREVAVIESRRNGKTEILVPRIIHDLRAGRHVLHTAQNRTLPRRVFIRVAHNLNPDEVDAVRYANGQEQILMRNGGEYLIVAPKRGARGLGADTLIFDELREFEDFDVVAAAAPTLTSSQNPQTIYLSNAGSDESVVLNDLKRRGEDGEDGLAYLEWSASPEYAIDDHVGWAEANPALGHFLQLSALETAYRTLPAAKFETEHLCRWVVSMQPRLVSESAWMQCRGATEEPRMPYLGINMSADGRRASFILAWQQSDGRIAVKTLLEAKGEPIDLDLLGKDVRKQLIGKGVRQVSFAAWTDADLARYFDNAKALDNREFANATENFVRLTESGRLVWDDAQLVTEDLPWTARKAHESGAWTAVPAKQDRPITSVLAVIRATWLASAPKPPAPQIF